MCSGLCTLTGRQTASGAFASEVLAGEGWYADENCCVTALVAFELLVAGNAGCNNRLLPQALDFIERCELPETRGRFRFYPPGQAAPLPGMQLGADLDDTALALTVLRLAGRRSPAQLAASLEDMRHYRTGWPGGREQQWVHAGVYRTWYHDPGWFNPVDACVNLNIATLLVAAEGPASAEAQVLFSAVREAVRLYGTGPAGIRGITPYYAHAAELFHAANRAAALGLPGAAAWAGELAHRIQNRYGPGIFLDTTIPICCNSHGQPLWYSVALQEARQLRLPAFSTSPLFQS
jgi:hypothetical protein